MTAKTKPAKRTALKSDFKPKAKRKAPSTAFKPGNPWRIKKGQVLNPTGRPKLLGEAYRLWLAHPDEQGITNAAKVAVTVGERAALGDIQSAKELRQATEGDHLTFDLSQLTDEQLARIANGEDPRNVVAASGAGTAGTEAETPVCQPDPPVPAA